MRRRSFRNISILHQYILSYTIIVLLACSMISVCLLSIATTQVNNKIKETQQYMLSLMADDIQTQVSTMEDIALKIAINTEYRPSTLNSNQYYESIMVERLGDYLAHCALTDEYFLLYTKRSGVFLPNAKNSETIYFSQKLGLSNGTSLANSLRTIQSFSVFSAKEQHLTLFSLPIRPTDVSNEEEHIVLTFVVRDQAWLDRFAIIGIDDVGKLTISYDKQPLVGEPVLGRNTLITGDTDDGFCLTLLPNRSGYITNTSFLMYFLSPTLIVVLFVTLGIGWVSAYRQYKPINRTLKQYAIPSSNSNELLCLSQSFDYYIQLNHNNLDKLDSQLALLRRQTILSLVCGESSSSIDRIASSVGICYKVPYLCAIALQTDTDSTRLLELIDNDQISFPCSVYSGIPYCDGCIPFLICANSIKERMDTIAVLLRNFRAANVSIRIGVGRSCNHLAKLPISFQEAISALSVDQNTELSYFENLTDGKLSFLIGNQYIEDVITDLQEGDADSVIRSLAIFFRDLYQSKSSSLLQRHVCACLLNEVILATHEMRIPFNVERFNAVMMACNLDEFEMHTSTLLIALCETIHNQHQKLLANNLKEIVWYVDTRCLQYDISLESVAERFALSTTKLSRSFRQQTGLSFKEYIISKRIAAAKMMLLHQNDSVADICQHVGYSNVSHFIKVFKDAVGLTPASYRQQQVK